MFKSARRLYWVTQSFLARHTRIILRTVGVVLLIVLAFFLFSKYLPSPKNTIRFGRVGKYSYETIPLDIQSLISQGLVALGEDGKILPGLAKSWELQDEGKLYVFMLDESIRWHDNSKLIADDITYNFKDVEVQREEGKISFKLKEPFSPFFSAVSRPLLKKNKFGTGEYRLTKINVYSGVVQSLTIESERERRIYKFYPTETSSLTAYKLGEIDVAEKLSFIPPGLENDKSSEISSELSTDGQQAVLFFNNNDVVLNSKSTRQALAYAVKDKTFGRERSLSPLDKSSWAYNPLVKSYDYDPERARSLLSQDVKDISVQKIELKTMLQYLDVAESIATSWRDTLGIQVDVKVVSSVTSDYQVLLADFTPPLDPDQYPIWHSTQATNFTHFSNLKIDKLLEDGRRTSDQKLRKEIYQDFQRFLLEDSPAVFLFKSNSFTLSRKSLFN